MQSAYQKVIDMEKHFKVDRFGLEILHHYLGGLGSEKKIPVTDEKWGTYMRDNTILTWQINGTGCGQKKAPAVPPCNQSAVCPFI